MASPLDTRYRTEVYRDGADDSWNEARSRTVPEVRPKTDLSTSAAQVIQEFEPARVKWFHTSRNFGFLSTFGDDRDVFVHAETVEQSGLKSLEEGHAVVVRVSDGPKGRIALELRRWEEFSND